MAMKSGLLNGNNNGGNNKSTKPSPTNAKESFANFYANGTSLPELKAGKYVARLSKHQWVAATTPEGKDYIRLELQLADRIILDNRFENNFELFLTQIKRQLGLQDTEIKVPVLLTMLMEQEFSIWIDFATVAVNGISRTFRNISYLPPLVDDINNPTTNY